MKWRGWFVSMISIMILLAPAKVSAQDPITEVIRQGIVKAIKAIDLQIQRLQNKTIWLQNAQKAVENTFSKLRLEEITAWVEKQKDLYQQYFEELRQVKSVLSYYFRIRGIVELQTQIVREYKTAYALFKKDGHLTAEEILFIGKIYNGILEESLKHLDEVFLVVNSFRTQMSDARRWEMINAVSEDLQENLNDLRRFNQQNKLLILSRAKERAEVEEIKKLY